MGAAQLLAGNKLDLQAITRGEFGAETMAAVVPLADGNYAQISDDGKQIVKYSFRTGKQAQVLFDADKARGPKVKRVEGYIMSPDGQKMLIQTNTERIYRRSFASDFMTLVS